MLQENKARKIFRKTIISYPLIRITVFLSSTKTMLIWRTLNRVIKYNLSHENILILVNFTIKVIFFYLSIFSFFSFFFEESTQLIITLNSIAKK